MQDQKTKSIDTLRRRLQEIRAFDKGMPKTFRDLGRTGIKKNASLFGQRKSKVCQGEYQLWPLGLKGLESLLDFELDYYI